MFGSEESKFIICMRLRLLFIIIIITTVSTSYRFQSANVSPNPIHTPYFVPHGDVLLPTITPPLCSLPLTVMLMPE